MWSGLIWLGVGGGGKGEGESTVDGLRGEKVVGHGFYARDGLAACDFLREVLHDDAAAQIGAVGADGGDYLAATSADVDEEDVAVGIGL